MIMHYKLVLVGFVIASSHIQPASALSNAARYLIDQEIERGCEGRGGSMTSEGVFERDLDGDGRADLILTHDGMACQGSLSRSLECGTQICTTKIYLRRGGLLRLIEEFASHSLSIGPGKRPIIKLYGHNSGPAYLQWNGAAFQRTTAD